MTDSSRSQCQLKAPASNTAKRTFKKETTEFVEEFFKLILASLTKTYFLTS